MSSKPKIAVIIGSARAARFADTPAEWIFKQAQARGDLDVELIDPRTLWPLDIEAMRAEGSLSANELQN